MSIIRFRLLLSSVVGIGGRRLAERNRRSPGEYEVIIEYRESRKDTWTETVEEYGVYST